MRRKQSIPDPELIRIQQNKHRILTFLREMVVLPRRQLMRWARLTKQTPNIKIGYTAQHLASLVTGVLGTRTGARGHDLTDKSEVKSCSRIDQLDKCKQCKAAVARIETTCAQCGSANIKRNNDSKWLFAIKSEEELHYLLKEIPRVVLILSDYPNFAIEDWSTIQFQVFEIWPQSPRHRNFGTLMTNYYRNIYAPSIEESKQPAPKNFWPYSFQFYMCNPVRTLRCLVKDADRADPKLSLPHYINPKDNRSALAPLPMPWSLLRESEIKKLRRKLPESTLSKAIENGLSEQERAHLDLRDTDHPSPQTQKYSRDGGGL